MEELRSKELGVKNKEEGGERLFFIIKKQKCT